MMKNIALLLLVSQALFAQTFLGAVKTEFEPFSLLQLERKIVKHAQIDNSYLSVGESHLETDSAGLINYRLIDQYISNTSGSAVFCAETIDAFLKQYLESIEEKTGKTKIFPGNSPYKTNFSKCLGDGVNHVTYSGFFHQYPFARSFPLDFTPTPVITDDDNNILSQMKNAKGMFVTQMEMEHLEFSATRALLLSQLDAKTFRKKAALLSLKTDALKDSMELVLDNGNRFTSKAAVVLDGAQFTEDLHGENNYFIFTNLEYRLQNSGIKSLKSLSALSDEKLEKFLELLKSTKPRIVSLFIGPDAQGNMGKVSFPGLSYLFEGGTLLVQLRTQSGNLLYAFERTARDFVCFDLDRDRQTSCF